MNILLITDPYPPEIRSVSLMMRELADGLVSKGHDVSVIASYPRHNLDAKTKGQELKELTVEGKVNVIRVKTPPHSKVNYLMRGLAQVMLPAIFFKAVKIYLKKKIDVVIVYSPPLTLALAAEKIKKVYGARYLLNVQDIFPQNAVDLGILKNRIIIRFFEAIEKRAYNAADHITTHTEGGRNFLIEKKGLPPQKVDVVSNWIDTTAFEIARATGDYRKRYGLEGKFIFLFTGIIGPSQNIDFLIDVAGRVADIRDICFLIVGDGKEKDRLRSIVERRGLKNIKFEPFVPQEEYPFLVKEADAGVICVNMKNRTSVMPGKMLGFMASSIPIAAFLNKENDCYRIIEEAGCGYAIPADDPDKAAAIVRKMFREREKLALYGRGGYEYALSRFSKKPCIDKLERIVGNGHA
jgi:glycosyltransferase involved in cell wall biosynthesis